MKNKQTIFIIDDDEDIRDGLVMMLMSIGLQSRSFHSGTSFYTLLMKKCQAVSYWIFACLK
jgi:FixJ family two-component response regulator